VSPASVCSITCLLPVAVGQVYIPGLSTINVQAPTTADTDPPDAPVTSPADNGDGGAAQLLTVPRDQFLTVDNMIQDVSTATLTSYDDYNLS